MGKFEEEASRKVLAGERIEVKTKRTLLDLLLWPIRAYQQKRREAEIRKRIFKS